MKPFFVVVIVFFVHSIYAQTAKEYYESGHSRMQSNKADYKGAINDFSKVIQMDSSYSDAFAWRGYAKMRYVQDQITQDIIKGTYNESRRYSKLGAQEDFNKAVELNPNEASYFDLRADFEFSEGEYLNAVQDYKRCVALDRLNKYVWQKYESLAKAEYEVSDYINSVQDYSNAIKIYDLKSHENYGAEIDKSMRVSQLGKLYLDRSKARDKNHEFYESIKDCNFVIALDSSCRSWLFIDAISQRASYKSNAGQYFLAIQDYNILIDCQSSRKIYNSANNYFLRGQAKLLLTDFRGGLEDANTAISIDSTKSEYYWLRGTCNSAIKNYKSAIIDLSRAIKIDPKDADSYYNRGLAKSYLGDKNGSCLDWSKAGELGVESAYELIKTKCN